MGTNAPHSLGQSHQAHIVLGIGTQLGQADQIDAISLDDETSWKVVSVALEVAVIKAGKEQNMSARLCAVASSTGKLAEALRIAQKTIIYHIIVLSRTIFVFLLVTLPLNCNSPGLPGAVLPELSALKYRICMTVVRYFCLIIFTYVHSFKFFYTSPLFNVSPVEK